MKEKISMPSLRTVQVSWFEDKRVSAPSGDLTLEQVADIICNPKCTFLGGRVLQLTTTARKMLDKGNKQAYDHWKGKMPAFTPAGLFRERRAISNCIAETGLALIDFDHLPEDVCQEVLKKAKTLPYVLFAWRSLSGTGVHLLIALPDSGTFKENIEPAQRQVIKDMAIPGLELDKVCKDVSRLCFFNHDPELYVNWDAASMVLSEEVKQTVQTPRRKDVPRRGVCNKPDIRLFMADLERYFQAKMAGLVKGSTATPTAGLAGMCNSRGYAEAEVVDLCWKQFGSRTGQTEEEFRNTFSFVYRKYADQFASKKDEALFEGATYLGKAALAAEAAIDVLEKDIELPVLPKEVYELLPTFFTDVLNLEKREVHEADAVVIGLLPLLGAALNNTEVYEGKWVYPAVYATVVGKPASGKGVVSQIQFLSALWEHHLQQYYEGNDTQPAHRVGGDITLAKFVEQLRDNGAYPLLQHDSEMNAMAKANKNRDTGGYDPILNKAYEGEDVLRSTKTAGNIVVKAPKLQLSMTGTKGQFFNAFETNENGLTSRLLGYVMPEKVKYKKLVYIESEDALKEREKVELQERYERLAASQANHNTPMRWVLSEKHTNKLNSLIKKQLEDSSDTPYEESTIIRMRAKVIRIAAILSAVRFFETGGDAELNPFSTGYLTIDDKSFRAACLIATTSFEHLCAMQSMLSEATGRKPMHLRKDWRDQFIEQLPDVFKYSEGLQLCLEYGKRKDSWKKALHYWQANGLLEKREDGKWVKLKPAPEADTPKQP